MIEANNVFEPARFFEIDEESSSTALVILNQPIVDNGVFEKAWKYSTRKICADGGANRLYDYCKTDERRRLFIPHYITGDFDSLLPHVREYYESIGTVVVHNPDQYSTDFMKCLEMLKTQWKPQFDVIAYGGIGGRVDQSFHSIHQLYSCYENGQFVGLVSEQSYSFVLGPGTWQFRTPLQYLGKTCGIIPIAGTARISTKGLEWDVNDWETKFGGQMSTSNHLTRDAIEISSDKIVLFTAELRESRNK